MAPTSYRRIILLGILVMFFGLFAKAQDLTRTAVNDIANSIRVYTYSSGKIIANEYDLTPSSSNQYLAEIFRKLEGVQKASYDAATGLITVRTSLTTELPEIIYDYQIVSYTGDDGEKYYVFDPEAESTSNSSKNHSNE